MASRIKRMAAEVEREDASEHIRFVEESISSLFVVAIPAMAERLESGEASASDFNALMTFSQKWADIRRGMATAAGDGAPKSIEIKVVRPGNTCPSCGELLPPHTPIKDSPPLPLGSKHPMH